MEKRRKTGGRQKGTPNKTTQLARDVVAIVADKLGGAERLVDWVKEDPVNERVFWKDIYVKLMPLQVTGGQDENGNDKPVDLKVLFVKPDAKG